MTSILEPLSPGASAAQLTRASDSITTEAVRASLPELDRYIDSALEKTGMPGLSIGIVAADHVVYLKGYGVREAGRRELVDPDTVVQLASMSKPITNYRDCQLRISSRPAGYDCAKVERIQHFRRHPRSSP